MPDYYKLLHEGKAKIIFSSNSSMSVIQHFKDNITAFNNTKKDIIPGKGIINNHISALLMSYLEQSNIKTHLIEVLNNREQLVTKVAIIPLEVVIRNVAAGSFTKRFNLAEGKLLQSPIIEFYYKNDNLSDPMVNDDHIIHFQWATMSELKKIKFISFQINSILCKIFSDVNISLIDFKIEFGRLCDNNKHIILADEISPDTCRLWDMSTNQKLDKDCYRLNLGNVIETYTEVARRLGTSYI
ncbi:phosphoribosylaminoimidazolesuccinocarboxamide synthase [Neoehrlichia mikurensis]|uniref:Phosphoribosylaminoimidazole-succinocarboxamide synthase n=1 Tax=Neoehrlichia mikurensis TaxID=89586 RepID=A0A9Q9BZZ9_9RICK|nr:phosphoribosylaminoimidazolesuccinocarboxamide synthase [Neoehrlichia mikurensis]QXK91701.1 phosphoribosylaminoimidazolesuccinocarboxamide synthase [Neoehrlichia mikurensis]QXK92912.1 phosphoribosylaminoimidazolesuccinocarboxamide synthase [Neoehrlichia mikurensis]QXK93392.1 phosphoribosylaminoimidazolesuccinocarboxamide synthase [Neoehrlichia mikurensis]UTO55659.1 phosphoribosylaminoimidazolesuccinocarboxamide synthase [Neoehrlichia mikurensis]UTO56580.1 phosphoribosylaminoimidazolesuccino